MKYLILFLLILTFSNHSFSQNTINQQATLSDSVIIRLDDAISGLMKKENLPGVAVGVWINGGGDYVTAKGYGNLNSKIPVDLNSPFRIASITKTFIATAILKLVSTGTITKENKLSTWYPDFPNANIITIEQLLQMRSGIFDSLDDELIGLYYDDPLMKIDADSLIKLSALKSKNFTEPDVKTVYCNLGYVFLEQIIEKVTGKDIRTYLKENIFDQLGLSNTAYPETTELPGTNRGYGWNSSSMEFEDKTVLNPDVPGGAGAMYSTMADLRTYVRALYTGELLTPELQKERMITSGINGSQIVKYGEGIGQVGKFWGHNGTIMGFSSEMYYLPEKDAVIIICVNRLDKDDVSMTSNLFAAVTKIIFPEYVDW